MFDFLFGWRKASKCKKLVKHLQCRLKIMKSKMCSIVKQSQNDIGELLENRKHDIAFARVERLLKDEDILTAYELLDHFCEFILIHFRYIRKHKKCCNDIKEAISTLIYAAAWFGDLPELQKIRKLFGERYGRKFTKSAVELCPGNLVNNQMKEKLCIKTISYDAKVRVLVDIAKDQYIKIRHRVFDKKHGPDVVQLCLDTGQELDSEEARKQAQMAKDDSDSPNEHKSLEFRPEKFDDNPLQVTCIPRNEVMDEKYGQAGESCGSNTTVNTKSHSKRATRFSERILCFDEVEEFQLTDLSDGFIEDKRVFWFNPTIIPSIENYGVCYESFSNKRAFSSYPFRRLQISKGNSTPCKSHVHPKLPDYDELAAKFTALKKAYRERADVVSQSSKNSMEH